MKIPHEFIIIMLSLCLALSIHSRARAADYTVSWIGNSFSGSSKWVQQDIEDIHVTQDGTIYSIVYWDEAGAEITVYKDGDVLDTAGHTHGWGYNGGSAIAVNNKYLYFGQQVGNEGGGLIEPDTWPPKGYDWYGVSRRHLSNIKQAAPFEGGKGGRKGDTLKSSFLLIHELPNSARSHIAGIWATDTRLYVSCPHDGKIRVYDAETMSYINSWDMERPGQMWMDSQDMLWIIQKENNGNPAKILRYSANGELQPQQIVLPDGVLARDLCTDSHGRLFVTDVGVNQQVRIYTNIMDSPEFNSTFGVKGGIYSGTTGEFGNLRFNDPAGIGADSSGNIYVASSASSAREAGGGGGSVVLESYAGDGALNWRLFGLHFIDCIDVDPASPSEVDVYTKEEHFVMDYQKPIGQQWKYKGYTVSKFKYPDDPRLHIWSGGAWIRRIQGRQFLIVNTMHMESLLQVYRFNPDDDGEVAIPSAMFSRSRQNRDGWPPHQPDGGEWIWRDSNGNGAFDSDEYVTNQGKDGPHTWGIYVDNDGNLWQATMKEGIRKFPLQGLDTHGNPIWNYETMQTLPMPEPFNQLHRIIYDPREDSMYLCGYTPDYPYDNKFWKEAGRVIARYDNWEKGNRTPLYTLLTPWNPSEKMVTISMTIAGEYLFLGEIFNGGNIHVYNKQTAEHVLDMTPGPEIGRIGWVDIPYGYTAYKRASGEYLIFVEDDWKAKVLMFRWTP